MRVASANIIPKSEKYPTAAHFPLKLIMVIKKWNKI